MTEISFESRESVIVKVRVTDAALKRRQQLSDAGKCVGCEREIGENEICRRGLCNACYQAARRAINSKKMSEQQLVRDGKMMPPDVGGRPTDNKFTRELAGK